MINPKSFSALTKCRPGCNNTKVCTPCKNFRKTFRPGRYVTWGICREGFEITSRSDEGIFFDGYFGRRLLRFEEANLQLAPKKGLLI